MGSEKEKKLKRNTDQKHDPGRLLNGCRQANNFAKNKMSQDRGTQNHLNDDHRETGQKGDKSEFLISFAGFGKNHPGGNIADGKHAEKEHNDIGLGQAGQV